MECSLHRALQGTLAVLTGVRVKDLERPTPCASWDVRALINHFIGSARWWAATIAGDGGATDADYAAGDFVAAYEESIRIAVAAFGADGALAGAGLAAGLLSQARLAIPDAYRGPDGQALFGPAREAPAGAGSADQLAAFLGRAV